MRFQFVVVTATPDMGTCQVLYAKRYYKSRNRARYFLPRHIDWQLLTLLPGEYVRMAFAVDEDGTMEDYDPHYDAWTRTPEDRIPEQLEILHDIERRAK